MNPKNKNLQYPVQRRLQREPLKLASRRFSAIFLLALLLLIVFSCNLTDSSGSFHTYRIKQGEHYSTHDFFITSSGDSLSFSFRFNESAVYTLDDSNQSDINKLVGFVEGSPAAIHRNSARFGWRWYNDELQILAYAYTSGERKNQLMGSAEIGDTYQGRIIAYDDRYEFIFNGTSTAIPRNLPLPTVHGPNYLSYPYFGGNRTAPHDVTIDIAFHLD